MCPQKRLTEDNLGCMTLESASEIAEAIHDYAEVVMLYFMGEPLQHSQISDFVEVFKSKTSAKIVLSTNATLLNRDMSTKLLDAGLDILLCCVDGHDKTSYEKIRRGAIYETVVSNVEELLGLSQHYQTRVVVKGLDFKWSTEAKQSYVDHWTSLGAESFVGWVNTWAGQLGGLTRIAGLQAPNLSELRVPCADLWFKAVINWQSKLVLCCHNFNYSHEMGSVTNLDSLETSWRGSAFQAARAAQVNSDYAKFKICSSCNEWGRLSELEAYLALDSVALYDVF